MGKACAVRQLHAQVQQSEPALPAGQLCCGALRARVHGSEATCTELRKRRRRRTLPCTWEGHRQALHAADVAACMLQECTEEATTETHEYCEVAGFL